MVGTTARELDRMYENECDRMIEELFGALEGENPNWGVAVSKLKEARSLMCQAIHKMQEAAELTENTIAEPRISSIEEAAEGLEDELECQINRME